MIIVYPEEGWNSFISVEDTTAALTAIGGEVAWNALTLEEQEQMLVKSALLISSVTVVSAACNFPKAQVILIHFDLVNDGAFLDFTYSIDDEYKSATVGSLSVEYNLNAKGKGFGAGDYALPEIVKTMLSDCMKNGGGARGFSVV